MPTRFIILFPIFINTITPTLILLFVYINNYFVITVSDEGYCEPKHTLIMGHMRSKVPTSTHYN
jgi:hypothetical protein